MAWSIASIAFAIALAAVPASAQTLGTDFTLRIGPPPALSPSDASHLAAIELWLQPPSLAMLLELDLSDADLFDLDGPAFAARLAEAHNARDVRGIQLGTVNWARDVRGVQIGALNVARRLRGVQIGGIQLEYDSPTPFFVGVHFGWYGRYGS